VVFILAIIAFYSIGGILVLFGLSAIIAFYSIGRILVLFGFCHHRFLQHRRDIGTLLLLDPVGFSIRSDHKAIIGFSKIKRS
jgi:hypothetical protein